MISDKSIDLDREREFHNRRFKEGDSRQAQQKYYWTIQRGAEKYWDAVQLHSIGADVLSYGCGLGEGLSTLLPIVKSLDGIDISDAAVEQARQTLGGPSAAFHVMDAMNLDFPDQRFDLVFGSGIIHHLDVELACKEIHRVLKPGGRALFWEPLGVNPIINAYRHITPNARTPDEHPLLPKDFQTMRKLSFKVGVEYFGLFTLGSVLLRNQKGSETILSVLERIDNVALKIPGFRFAAWYCIITLVK